jgi:hypothetical protein
VYVVVCVGESFTVPAASELVVTVREVEPEPVDAVMVTVVEFIAFQLRVTLCPAAIVFLLAEKIMVGVPELCEGLPLPLQAQRPKRAQSKLTKPILRTNFSFILPRPCFASGVQMPRCWPELLPGNSETRLPGLQ